MNKLWSIMFEKIPGYEDTFTVTSAGGLILMAVLILSIFIANFIINMIIVIKEENKIKYKSYSGGLPLTYLDFSVLWVNGGKVSFNNYQDTISNKCIEIKKRVSYYNREEFIIEINGATFSPVEGSDKKRIEQFVNKYYKKIEEKRLAEFRLNEHQKASEIILSTLKKEV